MLGAVLMTCTHCQEPLGTMRFTLSLPGCASCAPAPVVVCEACFRKLGRVDSQERADMIQRIQLALAETGGAA